MADDPNATAATSQNAKQFAQAYLAGLGIPQNLIDMAIGQVDNSILGGALDTTVLMQNLRMQPQWKAAFPGLDDAAKRGKPTTEAQWLSNKVAYNKVLTDAGMQPLTDQEVGTYIANDVSPVEMSSRVQRAYDAVNSSDMAKAAMQQYGLSPGTMAHFFLDPDKGTELAKREYQNIQMGAQVNKQGMGGLNLTAQEATALQAGGATVGQVGQQAGRLFMEQQLLTALPGEAGGGVNRSTELGFLAGSAPAELELKQRGEQRKAEFTGGGRAEETTQGIAGLRSSTT